MEVLGILKILERMGEVVILGREVAVVALAGLVINDSVEFDVVAGVELVGEAVGIEVVEVCDVVEEVVEVVDGDEVGVAAGISDQAIIRPT